MNLGNGRFYFIDALRGIAAMAVCPAGQWGRFNL
jgi:hypothetical protein